MNATTTTNRVLGWSLLLAASAACAGDPAAHAGDETGGCEGKCDALDDGAEDPGATQDAVCVAIRGNGPRIWAHFGALARISEEFGVPVAGAGGSSGSITLFLLESISSSVLLTECAGGPCDADARAERAAFLFKSIPAYVQGEVAEQTALGEISALREQIEQAGAGGLVDADGQLQVDVEDAAAVLAALVEAPGVVQIVNPEFLELLAAPIDLSDPAALERRAFFVQDLATAVRDFGAFSATEPAIFVRPGLVSFAALAGAIGNVAAFYGGDGLDAANLAGFDALLDECAAAATGLTWAKVAALETSDGSTCGEAFASVAAAHRESVAADVGALRLDREVGAGLQVLVTTGVLEGAAADTFAAARATYQLGSHDYDWSIAWDDVRFGYFGQAADLWRLDGNPLGFDDAKTAKRRMLGAATWREVLQLSPAEPGLSRAIELPEGRVSVGGWSDLFPVQALENLGCDRVVFITGEGATHEFQDGIATLLGMSDAEHEKLYDLGVADSAFALALEQADGAWCTDWNRPELDDIDGIFTEGYDAALETEDPLLSSYARATIRADRPGCTPGVSD
jgi:hypothetical protein